MANLKSSLKSTAAKAEATVVSLPAVRASKATSPLVTAIDKVCRSLKSGVDMIREAEIEIQKVLVRCIEHLEAHGDANPADRLVKGILLTNHPSSTALAREVIAHFRNNSPIRWESKSPYKLFVLKEGQEGYKAPDTAKAGEVPFNETPQAIKARSIGQAAQQRALEDATLSMMVKRAAGVIGFLNNMRTGKDERKIKVGEEAKMDRFAKALNGVLKDFGGEEAAVSIVKADPKKKAA